MGPLNDISLPDSHIFIEEITHPRVWSKEIIEKEISGSYADHASDPDFCKWLKESLIEAIEKSPPDGYKPISPGDGRRRVCRRNLET